MLPVKSLRLSAIALVAAIAGQVGAALSQAPQQCHSGQGFRYSHDLALIAAPEKLNTVPIVDALDQVGIAFRRYFGELPVGRGLILDHSHGRADFWNEGPEAAWILRWPLDAFRDEAALSDRPAAERELAVKLLAAIDDAEALKVLLLRQAQTAMGDKFERLPEEQRLALAETLLRSFRSQQAGIVSRARSLAAETMADDASQDERPTGGSNGRLGLESETLGHEVGHSLFLAAVWRDARPENASLYGSGAPDWLDEAAAILMEGDILVAQRRLDFVKLIGSGIDYVPLDRFLLMDHPVLQIIEQKIGAVEPDQVYSFSSSHAGTNGVSPDETNLFYARTRGFIDYLLARTGNDRVFLEIALHLKSGGTMESWLESGETARNSELPRTIAGLDDDFRSFSRAAAGLAADSAL